MSTYQYYYFEAADKPLTTEQQKELRGVSTRAEINSRCFVNEYHWGELRARPLELMKKYFDVHLYFANWGTRIVMLKVPGNLVDLELARQYETDETLSIQQSGTDVIFEMTSPIDMHDEWWTLAEDIKQFASLRDDLMAGDYRCLYLAWLAQYRDEDEECETPPVPAGMKHLTKTLESFADLLYVDGDVLETAIKNAPGDERKKPTDEEAEEWIAALTEKEKTAVLCNLLLGKELPQMIQRNLLNRFYKEWAKTSKSSPAAKKKPVVKKTTKKSTKKKTE